MRDFAKLVRATDGAQVLFLKDDNDDGKPTLYRMTEYEGITAKLGIAFSDDDFGYEACDKAYDDCDMIAADTFRKRVVELMAV